MAVHLSEMNFEDKIFTDRIYIESCAKFTTASDFPPSWNILDRSIGVTKRVENCFSTLDGSLVLVSIFINN